MSALAGLNKSRADSYSDWLETGMALQSVDGSLLGEWTRWSQQSDKFAEGECEQKWKSFGANGRITLGSLIFWTKRDGWTPPRRAAGERTKEEAAKDSVCLWKPQGRTESANAACLFR